MQESYKRSLYQREEFGQDGMLSKRHVAALEATHVADSAAQAFRLQGITDLGQLVRKAIVLNLLLHVSWTRPLGPRP